MTRSYTCEVTKSRMKYLSTTTSSEFLVKPFTQYLYRDLLSKIYIMPDTVKAESLRVR